MRDDTRTGLNQSADETGLLCLGKEVKALIPGGYYMMARKIEESWIATAAPCVREVWHWLIRNANHKEGKSKGDVVQRGQKIITTESLQDSLAWRIGYRKKKYSRRQCEGALKVLAKERMVVLAKVHHATLVTIVHYDFYQNPKNYEGASEATPEGAYEGTTKSQEALMNKNGENGENETQTPLIPRKRGASVKYPPFSSYPDVIQRGVKWFAGKVLTVYPSAKLNTPDDLAKQAFHLQAIHDHCDGKLTDFSRAIEYAEWTHGEAEVNSKQFDWMVQTRSIASLRKVKPGDTINRLEVLLEQAARAGF